MGKPIKRAKAYLQKAGTLNKLIKHHNEELAKLRELAVSVGVQDTEQVRVQGVMPGDKVADTVIKLNEMENQINAEIEKYIKLEMDIHLRINELDNYAHRLILFYHYVDGMSWKCIAEELNYCEQWVGKLHKAALDEFDRKFFNEN